MKTVEQLLDPFSPPETNLVDRLRYWRSAKPDELAFRFLVDGDSDAISLTYSQLDERVRACAAKLTAMGLSGQRALLMYPSGIEFIVALFGCHYAGVTPVPAYPPRRNRNMGRISAIADDAQTAVALTVAEVIERREKLAGDCQSLLDQPWLATETIPQELAGDWVKPSIQPDDVAVLQYTSGSTGSPKGVMLTHQNVMANCRYITTAFQIEKGESGGSWLPLYHDMGLVGGVINPLYVGVCSTIMSPVHFLTKPIRWLRMISDYKIQVSGGPNFAYALCTEKVNDEECADLDLSNWKLAFNGAEPIRADLLEKFSRKFEKSGFRHDAHYPCYGMAETTLLVTGGDRYVAPQIRHFDKDDLAEHKVTAVAADAPNAKQLVGCGKAVLDEEVIIVHPDSRIRLEEDQIGEIWIRSGSVGAGYLNKPDVSQETFQAELVDAPGRHYLRTGDLGFIDQGELFVAGRLKDMIIIRGVNRYPQDIESTVEQASPRLKAGGAAAFAVEAWDREKLIIVCEVERGPDSTWDEELQQIRAQVTEEHDLPPDEVVLVRSGSVPKTSSGKVQRHACRRVYEEDKLLVVDRWSAESVVSPTVPVSQRNGKPEPSDNQELLEIVCHYVRQVAKERAGELTPQTNIVGRLGT